MSIGLIYSDASLLARLSESDQQAFETIYLRYWRQLFEAAHKRLQNVQQSEDIVQNIFMGLWNKRSDLNILNLEAYLFTAVRYEVLDFFSCTKKTSCFHSLLNEIIIDTHSSADTKLLNSEMIELAVAYAQTLPEKRRHIFLLHLQNNRSTKEIADFLQVTQKTIQNQLRTALNGLFARINPVILLTLGLLLES